MLLEVWIEKADWALVWKQADRLNGRLGLFVPNNLRLAGINLLSEEIWHESNFEVAINCTLYLLIISILWLILESLTLLEVDSEQVRELLNEVSHGQVIQEILINREDVVFNSEALGRFAHLLEKFLVLHVLEGGILVAIVCGIAESDLRLNIFVDAHFLLPYLLKEVAIRLSTWLIRLHLSFFPSEHG